MFNANNNPLTDDELDLLETFIFSESVSEDSLDLIGIHGFLSAISICPEPVPTEEWQEAIFDGEPNWSEPGQKDAISALLVRWKNEIHNSLYSDTELEMPCDLTLESDGDEEAELEIWAQAFMEGVFLREDAWFNEDKEEVTAELMLPIMVASNLFDEPEFTEIRNNKRLANQMANEIPDILVDLYLAFHAPEK
ncbi:YecA family protein [Neptunomonas phycophila]|jgi:uncharacterized protein|uniref:YecA family protein n=1 Tax=Neptunomonas phycophila TaxID=1572645 RepID=A0AAW7XK44_9GAMM|nr:MULTISPECIES: YecA family protein [Neptunomonas]MBT3147411.1 YecA family protein [Neptunomonas phycophila]MDN2660415.1 YecA family protein [Neptunomonas sp. CHC150]MDO6453987.1 YecA family protein [Neptunomonas phycophila]MDO6469512.1 YecA family protein [Neptunomonas phycophila]MDO6785176.1 YecA family protein [Neptunomonas phycophila]